MTYRDLHLPTHGFSLKGAWTATGTFFAAIGHGLVSFGAQNGRLKEVERLNAKTDAELAAIGLRREEIAHHVFRDLHYI